MKKLFILIIFCLVLPGCQSFGDNKVITKEFIVGEERIIINESPEKVWRLFGSEEIFKPEVKLEKWGDETYIKVWSNEKGDEEATQVNDKIIWHNEDKSKEYNFYILSENKDLKEGGFEYEIILKEKPISNIIELKIESKGLVFYYQAPLDEEIHNDPEISYCQTTVCYDENDEIVIQRPENVIGSYAVYHAEKQGDYSPTGGKNYRAGKAFHIFRPKLIDANNNEIWGELDIDIEKGILKVTIDSNWLNNAVYPVKHATGLTFGHTSKGATTYPAKSSDRMFGLDGSPTSNGTGDSISVYVDHYSGTHAMKYALYEGTTVITNGETEAGTAGSGYDDWKTLNFNTAPTLSSASTYRIAGWFDANTPNIFYDSGVTGYINSETYNGWPVNPTWTDVSDRHWSIYCTYTETAADTCTAPTTGDWTVNLGDDCYVTTDTYVTGKLILIDNIGSGCLNVIDGATLAVSSWEATSTRQYLCIESDDGSALKTWTAS